MPYDNEAKLFNKKSEPYGSLFLLKYELFCIILHFIRR